MKRIFLLLIIAAPFRLVADEGMWLPALLDQLTIKDMRANGFKLTAEDIYSVNKSSMKDAIVHFNGGCTGELISSKGLILTNHHCGYGFIQHHSSPSHDYLRNGFWAMKQEEELPCPGAFVTFIVSMEDVTGKVLAGVSDTMRESSRSKIIDKNVKELERENSKDGIDAMVRAFYYGNDFYMFFTQTFRDIRMVGAPPQTIGNFGGDSDNWMWPRQTGDFSLFRVYADKNNKPAAYSADNVPYTPKHFFRINANGVGENDFTMVYGFPGRTSEYLSSYGVSLIQKTSDPVKVELREKRIVIMEEEMLRNDTVRIQYAAKRNGTANNWKKWQGEMMGLERTNAISKKQATEAEFTKRIQADAAKKAKYGSLLRQLDSAYKAFIPWETSWCYMNEGCFSVEMIRFAQSFQKLIDSSAVAKPNQQEIDRLLAILRKSAPGFYKDFDTHTDKRIAIAMFSLVASGMDPAHQPPAFALIKTKYKGDFKKYFDQVYARSLFADEMKIAALLANYKAADWKKLSKDPAYLLATGLYKHYTVNILPHWQRNNEHITRLNRIYMKAQMEVVPEKRYYPDANSTLRIAYGKIIGYQPRDGVKYNWFCTLDGVMEKEDSLSLDYQVPARLRQLYDNRDFGTYADKKDGKLHTSFIASNHTTGGNSGSPVLDAYGNLIGTNFDRGWEGTMSDVSYDVSLCRNITLDIRYTLFIIDKYAGAGYLLKEMVFVK